MQISVCFYRGRGLASLLIRAFTRLPGQAWKDVPSHVGVRVNNVLYEALVVEGVQARAHKLYKPYLEIPVSLPDPDATLNFLLDQISAPYDWVAIFLDTIGRVLLKTQLRCLDNDRWHCSRLAAEALRVGGMQLPDPRLPESPNDLLQILKGHQ